MFGRQKSNKGEVFIRDILDASDSEILVVRGKDCRVLFANNQATAHMGSVEDDELSCKKHYCSDFSYLCEHCPQGRDIPEGQVVTFEAETRGGRAYRLRAASVTWLDGSRAMALMARDIQSEQESRQRLYQLAYMDHLTGIPNRQRLKEDFEALAVEAASGRRVGVMAIFDLDHFKTVNDTYGHNTGDLMLCRLADHLKGSPHFSAGVYRLGGDEFVLLLSESCGRFESDEALIAHYTEVLSKALQRYSIPNIEVSCTLSMGAAVFPRYGSGFSELLRKADIALYEAKDQGRDRLVFFEDRYDNAKKFKDLFINIQPVLMSSGKTFGYELIDQGGSENGEDESAVQLTEMNRTLDALGLGEMNQGTRYFIAYSSQLFSPLVLQNLPRDLFVIQMPYPRVLADREIEKYRRLKAAGYKLAITGVSSTTASSDILAYADFCKFDPADTNLSMQKRIIAKHPKIVFIACRVDNAHMLQATQDTGFKLFQGFFFSAQATVKKTKEIDPLKFNYFRLLKMTSSGSHVDFREISAIISADVALSYKLLRLLNSAAVGLRNVSSIQMAVTYLGEENLKKWIGLLALRGITEDKPLELVRMSLIRAQFGELLCPHFRLRRDANQVFLTGMLSLLHVALETTREALLEDIPVAEEIRESLLTGSGPYSDLLRFFESYEYGNWDEISQFCQEHHLSSQVVNDCYVQAVRWYNDLSSN